MSTGFSPLELLYGRKVCRLLDVLQEIWEEPMKGGENVITYMLAMRDRLGSMTEMYKRISPTHRRCKRGGTTRQRGLESST